MMTSASADENEYFPLVCEGVVWEYVEYNSELGIHPDVASIYTLEFNGVCEEGYKLYRTDYNANGTANEPYLIAYANEANKVVTLNIDDNLPYYLNDYTIAFDKIYDYNNDELYFLPDEAIYMSYQLANVDGSVAFTVEVGNTTRKGYHVNYDAEHDIDTREFKIIEGIGVDCMYGDLFEPFRTFPTCIDGYRMSGLSAVYENGELVYQGCMFDIAQQLKNPASNGDVNGDGVVTSADVTCLYNYLLNGDSNGIVNGDQDGDGIITAADITAVYNILLGSVPESHEWVDLGLPSGTLWATMNIGASSPEEYGDYFAWGETTPKEYYEWNTYKWCMGSNNTLTKYCTNSYYGYNSFVDNDVELDPEDDAATVNWGAGWQMPTLEQIDELKDCSSSEWMTLNDVYGRLFTGSNGASLFLPAAGYRWKGTIYKAGSYGRYWSSTPRPDYPCYAYYLNFLEEYVEWIYFDRDIGFSVRAVRAPQK